MKWILLALLLAFSSCSERNNVPGEKERSPSESTKDSKSHLA